MLRVVNIYDKIPYISMRIWDCHIIMILVKPRQCGLAEHEYQSPSRYVLFKSY